MPSGIPWNAGAWLVLEGARAAPAQFSSTLEQAVRTFWETDWELQSTATLFVDRAIALDGQPPRSAFYGDEIDAFVGRLSC
jgi:hypothetical protein